VQQEYDTPELCSRRLPIVAGEENCTNEGLKEEMEYEVFPFSPIHKNGVTG
jgi:hypothetical protein